MYKRQGDDDRVAETARQPAAHGHPSGEEGEDWHGEAGGDRPQGVFDALGQAVQIRVGGVMTCRNEQAEDHACDCLLYTSRCV